MKFLAKSAGLVWVLAVASACSNIRPLRFPGLPDSPAEEDRGEESVDPRAAAEKARLEAHAKLPAHPLTVEAAAGAEKIRAQALARKGSRILVSTRERALWLMQDDVPVFKAPVAVGMHEKFTWAGKTYDFATPHSIRKVLAKSPDPLWVPPDWHYFEKAAEQKLEPVQLKSNSKIALSDGTRIEVRGDQVGRVNRYGNFWPFTPGMEIIFDGKIFIPPFGTAQRKVPEVLGTHKLEIGDGYLIHGTNEDDSIGEAVSHGCVRMYNADVAQLYAMVPVGTPVYIF